MMNIAKVGQIVSKPLPQRPPSFFRLAIVVALALASLQYASAQVQVDITLKRTLYIAYEPLIVNVSISNLSGASLELADIKLDSSIKHWFSFQIETLDNRPIAPRPGRDTDLPMTLEAGQKITRSVNLTPLYPITEYGGYRIQASVYAASLGQYFNSPPLNVEITEGRVIYEKTVGVPESENKAASIRHIAVLTHRLPNSSQLYIRIQESKTGTVFCTHRLGRLVSSGPPDILLDSQNRPNILQNVAPKVFLYSHIGLNGEVIERTTYNQTLRHKPYLKLGPAGNVTTVGGQEPLPEAAEKPLPNSSDRPFPVPGSQTDSNPNDQRPRNLLSE